MGSRPTVWVAPDTGEARKANQALVDLLGRIAAAKGVKQGLGKEPEA